MTHIDFKTTEAPFEGLDWEQAYESVKSDLVALPVDELVPINLDIQGAVITAAGVIPEVNALRAEMEELPGFDIERFDKLPQYAMATGYAHSRLMMSARPTDRLPAMYEEGDKARDLLSSDAVALAKRGLIPLEAVAYIGSLRGYKNMSGDLRNLVTLFRTNWDQIEGKCATTKAEVDRAAELASALVQAFGLREQGPAELNELADMRARAYTLFLLTYNEARSAVSYLRREEGDVDSIIPSLFSSRTRRGKKVETEETEDTPSATLPVVTNVVAIRPETTEDPSTEQTG
jgi:hypothetical protein